MTDKELEKKVVEYVERKRYRFEGNEYEGDIADGLHDAYIAGAKENGIVWHDLRKNPDDLPSEHLCYYLNERGERIFWTGDKWGDNGVIVHPNAWCEIPKFEEEK